MPQAMGNIPFMTRFATSMMKKQMTELDLPTVLLVFLVKRWLHRREERHMEQPEPPLL